MDIELYGIALFLHVVLAIALVGGSTWAHVTAVLLPKATTVEGIRSHVRFLQVISKSGIPIALGVLIPGVYMAFEGGHWGAGWPAVSLFLFAMAGAGAGAVIDPAVAKMQEALDGEPDGPVTPALGAKLANSKLTFTTWVMAGADLAIVFLMTNKPGWTGSIVVGGVCLALGATIGIRESRHAAGAAAATPAV